jgi:hypothetical protein
MGWAYGTNNAGREVGYGVESTCDKPECDEAIDRGLYFVCGSMHDGDEHGCGRYFCDEHMLHGFKVPDYTDGHRYIQLCEECAEGFEEENDGADDLVVPAG